VTAIGGAGPSRLKGKATRLFIVFTQSLRKDEAVALEWASKSGASRIYLVAPTKLSIPIDTALRIDSGIQENSDIRYSACLHSPTDGVITRWTRILHGPGGHETYNEYPLFIGGVHRLAMIRGEKQSNSKHQNRKGDSPSAPIWAGESGFRQISSLRTKTSSARLTETLRVESGTKPQVFTK